MCAIIKADGLTERTMPEIVVGGVSGASILPAIMTALGRNCIDVPAMAVMACCENGSGMVLKPTTTAVGPSEITVPAMVVAEPPCDSITFPIAMTLGRRVAAAPAILVMIGVRPMGSLWCAPRPGLAPDSGSIVTG